MLVGHDATSIFLYHHHPVKGRERKGGSIIASGFDRSSRASREPPDDHKFQAASVGCACGTGAHCLAPLPESLT
jgi:hypothetical protein